ncbi:MAG TPA: hypothetical protein VK709_18240 [Candidatus Saccharimonadales bacterium]|jgi:protein phosphatase 1 regulatory subunit 7|nr:hypothetical protein [Candidatus Saccharimonadales bacterium]
MYELERVGAEGFRLMGPPAFRRSIFVESQRIDACMEYAFRNDLGIAIAPLTGFKSTDLSFLSRYPSIEHLTIIDSEKIDVSAVSSLKELGYLRILGRTKQPIDLSSFPVLRDLQVQWWSGLRFGETLPSLRVLTLSHYKPSSSDLTALPAIPHLERLHLVQCRKLALTGIDRFSRIKKLSVSYFPGLTDISPLAAFESGDMESLEFQNCPNIANHNAVKVIWSLKRLAFNRCGEIPSLAFLNELPALESFSFVDTNIIDGDLTSCLRLRFAGFFDKRHYNYRRAEFPPAGGTTSS